MASPNLTASPASSASQASPVSSINSDFANDKHSWPEIVKQVAAIGKAGYTHMQWIHDWQGDYLYSPSEMLYARALCREHGLVCHTLHASEGGTRGAIIDEKPTFRNRWRLVDDIRKDYTSTNEYIRLAGVDLLKNRIDLCSCLGAAVMVLHMQLPFEMFEASASDKEAYYAQVFKSLDELRYYAEASGVRIAFENMIVTPRAHQLDCFDRLFDRYPVSYVGLCFDSGHATLQFRENYYELLERYPDRVLATHLQDNDGVSEENAKDDLKVAYSDAHRMPKTGILDWGKIATLLAATAVRLPVDFEVVLKGTEESIYEQLAAGRFVAEAFNEEIRQKREAR